MAIPKAVSRSLSGKKVKSLGAGKTPSRYERVVYKSLAGQRRVKEGMKRGGRKPSMGFKPDPRFFVLGKDGMPQMDVKGRAVLTKKGLEAMRRRTVGEATKTARFMKQHLEPATNAGLKFMQGELADKGKELGLVVNDNPKRPMIVFMQGSGEFDQYHPVHEVRVTKTRRRVKVEWDFNQKADRHPALRNRGRNVFGTEFGSRSIPVRGDAEARRVFNEEIRNMLGMSGIQREAVIRGRLKT